MKAKNNFYLCLLASCIVLSSCEKKEADDKNSADIIIVDDRELSINKTKAWITSGGYLSDIDIYFNDSKAKNGLSQITFSSQLSICGGLPEVGQEYIFNSLAVCRFSSARFFTNARTVENPSDYEVWNSPVGNIIFSIAEKNTEKKVYHFVATYTVTFVDLENKEHGPIVGKFDIEQSY